MKNVVTSLFPEALTAESVRDFKADIGGSTRPHHGHIEGREYVLKCGEYSMDSSDEHVHNEYVADCLLRAAGCRVPASKEYCADIGFGRKNILRLSEFIPRGRTLTAAFASANADERKSLIRQIVETYPAIAFIDGTDTYQHQALDNVLVDEDYRLWFVDNGAAFDFRARGKRKNWFWQRTDAEDSEHGYYAILEHADPELKKILASVSREELKASAAKVDFVGLIEALPEDYRRPALYAYARSMEAWAKGENLNGKAKASAKESGIMKLTEKECDYLENASLVIAKAVRRINRFIDKGRPDDTPGSRTMAKFKSEVDQDRLVELAQKDPTGRVNLLLQVCDAIANSAAAGFAVRVLADCWHPNDPSCQRPGRRGNVDFADFAFDRKLMKSVKAKTAAKKPGGKASASVAKIHVVKGDVATTVADAVVNAANERLWAGSGICGAIFRRAGLAQLQAACDKVAPCPTGEARVTPAFGITNAKFIIHAVGPRYVDGQHGEPEKLASCYRNLLSAAVENGCTSVAVPSISTGVFGYPLKDAATIAIRETRAFLATHSELEVIFVAWDIETKDLYEGLLSKERN